MLWYSETYDQSRQDKTLALIPTTDSHARNAGKLEIERAYLAKLGSPNLETCRNVAQLTTPTVLLNGNDKYNLTYPSIKSRSNSTSIISSKTNWLVGEVRRAAVQD